MTIDFESKKPSRKTIAYDCLATFNYFEDKAGLKNFRGKCFVYKFHLAAIQNESFQQSPNIRDRHFKKLLFLQAWFV